MAKQGKEANSEKDNFQDRAETREYRKGYRAGSTKRSGTKKKGSRRGRRDSGAGSTSSNSSYAVVGGEINDPNWNAPTAQILKDTFTISFPNVLGQPVSTRSALDTIEYSRDGWGANLSINVPTIMTLDFMPTYGDNMTTTDPINTGANSFYAYVVHMNSRNKSYDAPDLMQLGLALDSCYMWYLELCRMYGYINYYQWYNRSVPRALINMLGFDYDDIIGQLADLRSYINAACYRLSQIFFPRGFDYMDRHMWLVRDVYCDAASTKAQLYAFVPTGYYLWCEGPDIPTYYKDKIAGGLLQFRTYGELLTLAYESPNWADQRKKYNGKILKTFGDIKAITDLLINRIIQSQDFNLMSGDIMKAYGPGNHIQLQGIAETYALTPVYSKEILMEIENSEIFTPLGYALKCDIFQPPQVGASLLKTPVNLYYDKSITTSVIRMGSSTAADGLQVIDIPKGSSDYVQITDFLPNLYGMISSLGNNNNYTHIINMHTDTPTDKDVAVAINFKVSGVDRSITSASTNGLIGQMYGFGTEILTNSQILLLEGSNPVPYNVSTFNMSTMKVAASDPVSFEYAKSLIAISSIRTAFDWFPFFRVGAAAEMPIAANSRMWISKYFGDFENYTTIDGSLLNYMHQMANLNKFTCHNMGGFTPK